jgi:hypothetical protein
MQFPCGQEDEFDIRTTEELVWFAAEPRFFEAFDLAAFDSDEL